MKSKDSEEMDTSLLQSALPSTTTAETQSHKTWQSKNHSDGVSQTQRPEVPMKLLEVELIKIQVTGTRDCRK